MGVAESGLGAGFFGRKCERVMQQVYEGIVQGNFI